MRAPATFPWFERQDCGRLLCKTGHFSQILWSQPPSSGARRRAELEPRLRSRAARRLVEVRSQRRLSKLTLDGEKPGLPRDLRDVRPITSMGAVAPANFEGEGASFPGGPEHFQLASDLRGGNARPWRRRRRSRPIGAGRVTPWLKQRMRQDRTRGRST